MSNNQENDQSLEIDTDMTTMVELTDSFKKTIIVMFKNLKQNMNIIRSKIFIKPNGTFRDEKYLKKNLLDGFNIRLDTVEKNKRLSKGKHKEKN